MKVKEQPVLRLGVLVNETLEEETVEDEKEKEEKEEEEEEEEEDEEDLRKRKKIKLSESPSEVNFYDATWLNNARSGLGTLLFWRSLEIVRGH